MNETTFMINSGYRGILESRGGGLLKEKEIQKLRYQEAPILGHCWPFRLCSRSHNQIADLKDEIEEETSIRQKKVLRKKLTWEQNGKTAFIITFLWI